MKLWIGMGVAALLVTAAVPALAQSAGGSGSITVLRQLSVTKNTDLAFGTVVEPATGSSTVTISNAGARSSSPALAYATGSISQANFTVSGEGGQAVTVTVPATFTITGPNSSTLTVTTTNDAGSTLSGSLGGAGSMSVDVGGSVTVANNTTSGTYTGTFTVSAAYN